MSSDANAREQVHQVLHPNALQRAHRPRDFLAQPFVRVVSREIMELRHDFAPAERPRREPRVVLHFMRVRRAGRESDGHATWRLTRITSGETFVWSHLDLPQQSL